jgi:hypothetical protein
MVHRGLRNAKTEGPYSAPRHAFDGICVRTNNMVKLCSHRVRAKLDVVILIDFIANYAQI